MADQEAQSTTEKDERLMAIWSTNAWVGMNRESLSPEAAERIFRIALEDVMPGVTDAEVGYALGMVAR